MGENANDEDLLAKVAGGDAAAYRTLVDRHADRILALCRRILPSRADAEDATQEVFLTVWQKAGEYRPMGARFTTWLYRVAVNRALKHKERNVMRHDPIEAADGQTDPAPQAEEQLDAAQGEARVQAAVARLPAMQRVAVTLTYAGGLANAEAAQAMDISVKALESLLVRARRSLRLALAPTAGQRRT